MTSNQISVYGAQRADIDVDLMAQIVIMLSRELAHKQTNNAAQPVTHHEPSVPPAESLS